MPCKRGPSSEGTNVPACATGRMHDAEEALHIIERLDHLHMCDLKRSSGLEIAYEKHKKNDGRKYHTSQGKRIDAYRQEDARLDERIRQTEQQLAQMLLEAQQTSEDVIKLEEWRAELMQECHYWQQQLEQCSSGYSGPTARSRLIAHANSMLHEIEDLDSSSSCSNSSYGSSSCSSTFEPLFTNSNPSAAAARTTPGDASCFVRCKNTEQLQQQLPAVDCSSESWAVDYNGDAAVAADTTAEKQQPLQRRLFNGFATFSSKLWQSCRNLFSRSRERHTTSFKAPVGLGWCSCVCKGSASWCG